MENGECCDILKAGLKPSFRYANAEHMRNPPAAAYANRPYLTDGTE
jgi:hypothetical protein